MIASILTSVKRNLGIAEADESFDPEIVTHINGAFTRLYELGIGPQDGFRIEDDTVEWDTYLGDNLKFESVKNYVTLHTRLFFDPPATQYLVQAFRDQLDKLEWNLNVTREHTEWVDPDPELPEEDDIIDGGDA